MVKKIKYDIGCGDKPKEGYIGIDTNPDYNPDLLLDADEGLPFKDNTVDAIWMDNSLEHFANPIFILQECHRVLRSDGIIEVIIPNLQWWPLLIISWFTDLHKFWNNWMMKKKPFRGIHFTMWTPYTLGWNMIYQDFNTLERKGWHLGKEFYIKAVK